MFQIVFHGATEGKGGLSKEAYDRTSHLVPEPFYEAGGLQGSNTCFLPIHSMHKSLEPILFLSEKSPKLL